MNPVLKFTCALVLLCTANAASSQISGDAELAAHIRAVTNQSDVGLTPVKRADGSIEVDLKGRFQHAYVAQLNPAGQVVAACVGSVVEANAFFGRDLETGKALPKPKMSPAQLTSTAALHGMTEAEYAFYWGLIEQAKFVAPTQKSSTFAIINSDGANEGFNSTVARPADGANNAPTLGGQRLALFNSAASVWAAFLDSTITINVQSNFDSIAPCSSMGGTLGSAGAINIHGNFANAPLLNTLYSGPLANKIANSDLSANPEIIATFNSDVDTGCLGAGTRFWYGLDNTTPVGTVNLFVVVLHEIGHGLGFQTFTNTTTGAFLGGFPDVWARLMFDRVQNLTWFQMTTNAQRQSSAITPNNLLWDGPNVRIASGFLTAGREAATGRVEMFTPNPFQPGSSVSHWNTTATPNLLMEPALNSGLPLTTDLTRQLFRDLGWFRDANNNAVEDQITNVAPSGGAVVIGANTNITWTNPASFSRNVTIELSTNSGATFPTTIAADVANTGTRTWTVPNTPTTTARIRVREHDFVAPAAVSAVDFIIGAANTAPTFVPAAAISRQRGSPGGAAVNVGTAADAQTAAGSLSVTQIAGGTSAGVSATGITNTIGTIAAVVAASCTATQGTLRFQASDGSLTGTGDLQVNITANTAPVLTYAAANLNGGAGSMINPAAGPGDNGSVTTIALQSQGTYSGGIVVNNSTGVITLTAAAPFGTHTITIRATDNCGTTTDASFQLTVNNTAPTFTPAAATSRQQGSPGGAAVNVGTAADAQTAAGSLTVTQVAGGTSAGVSASGITNTTGTVAAVLAASCTATAGTLRFQVNDGGINGAGDLTVNITPNTAPVLTYAAAANVNSGAGTTINPATGPSDNGSVSTIALQSQGTYTGGISVANATGVITLTNAAPVGTHTITISATDSCGANTSATFTLGVQLNSVFANGFE